MDDFIRTVAQKVVELEIIGGPDGFRVAVDKTEVDEKEGFRTALDLLGFDRIDASKLLNKHPSTIDRYRGTHGSGNIPDSVWMKIILEIRSRCENAEEAKN